MGRRSRRLLRHAMSNLRTQNSLCTMLGYACHLVTVSLLGWNGMLLLAPSSLKLQAALSATDLTQAIFYPVTFLIVGFISCRRPLTRRPTLLFVISSLATAMSAMLFLGLGFYANDVVPLASISGVLIGMGTAGFFMLWQIVFATHSIDRAAAEIIGGTLIAGILFFGIVRIGVSAVSTAAFATCLVTSIVLLWRAHGTSDFSQFQSQAHQDRMRQSVEALRGLWHPALCIAALGFASGIAPIVFFNEATVMSFTSFKAVARVLSALVLLMLWKRLSKRNDRFALFYRVAFPIVATGFLLLPFFGLKYQLAFSVLAYLIFSIASMIMMVLCANEAQDRKLNPLAVYGLFAGFVYALNRIGKIAGSSQGYTFDFGFSQLLMLALFVIYLLSIILMFTRAHPKASRTPIAISSLKTADHPASPSPGVHERIDEVCERLAAQVSLTPREQEVLGYLARGRNVTFISEQLVVSDNTVRAHCKGIYRKLDVHSRQELLSLVEREGERSTNE